MAFRRLPSGLPIRIPALNAGLQADMRLVSTLVGIVRPMFDLRLMRRWRAVGHRPGRGMVGGGFNDQASHGFSLSLVKLQGVAFCNVCFRAFNDVFLIPHL